MLRLILVIGLVVGLFGLSADVAADDMAGWKKTVITKYKSKFRYPRSAIQKGIQGSAKVRLFIAADGTITKHEVVEATGERVLDRELPKLVERLSPLPAPPTGEDEMTLILPVTWRLS